MNKIDYSYMDVNTDDQRSGVFCMNAEEANENELRRSLDVDDQGLSSPKKEILTKIFLKTAVIPNSILFDLLDKTCFKYNEYYLFNYTSFRKIVYHNYFEEFTELLKPFYQIKALTYITKRPITYNIVATVLRQVCTWNHIPFKIKRQYNHSLSNNDYYIYHNTK